MLTLLGSLLGFVTSAFPDLLGLFRDRQDRKHELAILNRQMELQKLGHSQRLEEIEVQADIAESKAIYRHDRPIGVAWVDALRATVRPVITYAFFALFAAVMASDSTETTVFFPPFTAGASVRWKVSTAVAKGG